jgi:hypothetical protein
MAVLSEITTTGKTWIRANQIHISNELDQLPTITWTIEKAIEISGETVTKHMQDLMLVFDPAEKFDVRNPADGKLLGYTLTKGELYAMIYSAFWNDVVNSGIVSKEKIDVG